MNTKKNNNNAYWHIFNFLDQEYLYDVESGALHRVDMVMAKVADLYPYHEKDYIVGQLCGEYDEQVVSDTYDEILYMIDQGLLSSLPEDLCTSPAGNDRSSDCGDQRHGIDKPYSLSKTKEIPASDSNPMSGYVETAEGRQSGSWDDDSSKQQKRYIKALCLHIAHDCNLRCSYCFASTGGFGGERGLMSEAVGYKAVDMLLHESGPIRNLEIDYFGGEPLLNFEVVKKITEYARQEATKVGKTVHFTLTTNCVALDKKIIDYMNRNEFSVILSLDGRPETHDRWRKTPSGKGSYKKVAGAIQDFLKSTKSNDYYVRGTYTKANIDFTNDILHMRKLGIDKISMEPVVSAQDQDYAISGSDMDKIKSEYEKLVKYYSENASKGDPFEFFHFNMGFLRGQCHERRLLGCGAGYQYLAVTPTGDLYPCHQFVGKDEYKQGDVFDGIVKHEIGEYFEASNIKSKPECQTCWVRYLCSGGCHAAALQANGDMRKPDQISCRITKIRIEAALAAYAVSQSD